MRPYAKSKWPGCVTWLTGSSAKAGKLKFFPFCSFNLIRCWTLFIVTKTTLTFGSKSTKTLAPDAVMYHSDWSKVSTKEKVSSSLHCLRMLVTKHFHTHNVQGIFQSLKLQKQNLVIIDLYAQCKAISPLCKSVTEVVFICHVREWKHQKYSLRACPFSGVEFRGAFYF